ncbi:MAG: hypothetical protein E7298_14155 [Lachnospiraceae bacterium]|nr:hypothetical protein [Lachnospiraceae bacterium]
MEKTRNFEELFRILGITVNGVDKNYNPELYGRSLMSGINTVDWVSYSVSTEPINTSDNNINNRINA